MHNNRKISEISSFTNEETFSVTAKISYDSDFINLILLIIFTKIASKKNFSKPPILQNSYKILNLQYNIKKGFS